MGIKDIVLEKKLYKLMLAVKLGHTYSKSFTVSHKTRFRTVC